MIVCGQCGERNEDGSQFCGACGEFLEWAGQPADRVPATSPPTTTPVTPTPTYTAPPPPNTHNGPPPPTFNGSPPPAFNGSPPPAFNGQPAPPTAMVPTAMPSTGLPPTGVPPTSAPPTSAPPVSGGAPVSGPPVSGPPVSGDPATPRLRRPDEKVERQRAPVNLPEQRRLPMPGEKICGNCGAGNDPGRRFCNACGHSLADAPVAKKLPWWRRFLRWVFRRRVYHAGERRDVRQPIRWQRPTLILTVLALLIVGLAVPPGRTLLGQAITAIQDRFGKRVPVVPVAGRATSSAAGHGPAMAFDGASNTYWAPAGGRSPLGQGIVLDLPQPVRLLNVIITAGVSPDKTAFLAQGRPAKVDVTITDRAGKTHTSTLTLQDEPGGQRFSVAVSNAVQVTLIIRSDYGVPPGQVVAIAEVELFARG